MVTVELAIGFVTAAVLTVALSGLVSLGVHQAACAGASAEVARQLARGDHAAASKALSEAPVGATQEVTEDDEGVSVTVAVDVPLLGVGEVEVSAHAWSRWEATARP